jgi:toxin FitB
MPYLLDTNVICEATAKLADPQVLGWIEAHTAECFLSCLTLAEIWKGLHRLPEGKRKRALTQWAENLEADFAAQTLGLDRTTLQFWGRLYAAEEAAGRNRDVFDSLLAATALQHRLIVVTRNTADFPAPVKTLNPWRKG